MIGSRTLAYRYARALADIGLSRNRLEDYGRELSTTRKLLVEVPEAARILKLPIFPRTKRELLLNELTTRLGLSDVVSEFLKLLLDENRFTIFEAVVDVYEEIIDDVKGRLRAKVYSARPLEEREKEKLTKALEKRLGAKEVVLDCRIDEDLIGGVKIEVKSLIFDATLKNQLRRIQAALEEG